ncbi:TetR/AcrR family transcriptional regulator [Kocuria sp. KH4]
MRAEILAAAGTLLLESGMGAFTIEAVAARSGASKMTIYKMWPSKGALALEGYFATVEDTLAFRDTGDIRADLTTQLHAFIDLLTASPAGEVVRELIGHAQTDLDLRAQYLRTYSGPRRKLAVQALTRAVDRGQLRHHLDCESVVDQLWGACYHRLLLPDQPLTHAYVDHLITNLFDGITNT